MRSWSGELFALEKKIAALRLAGLVAVLLYYLIRGMAIPGMLRYVLLAAFAWNVAALAAAARRWDKSDNYRFADILVDAGVISILIWANGRAASDLYLLYFLLPFAAFVRFGRAGGIGAGVVCAVAYLLLAIFSLTIPLDRSILGHAFARSAALLAYSILLGLSVEQVRNSALLKQQTVDDLAARVAELEAEERQLKASFRETNQLHRETKKKLDETSALFKIASLPPEEELEKNYRALVQTVTAAMGCKGGELWLLNRQGSEIEVKAALGRAETTRKISSEETLTPTLIGPEGEEALLSLLEAHDTDTRPLSQINAPIKRSGMMVGLLSAFDKRSGASFDEGDKQLLQRLAEQAALTLEMLRNAARLRQARKELTVLSEIARVTQSTQDPERILNATLDLLKDAVSYEHCTIFMFDREKRTLEPVVTRGRSINLIEHIRFDAGVGISGWVAQQRKQILIPDLSKEARLYQAARERRAVGSFVSVPLLMENEVAGVINMGHSEPEAFSEEDVRLLSILASQAVVAVERALRYKELGMMAVTDPVTLIYNHRFFQTRLEEEIRRSERYRFACSLLMIDIDRFKSVNDTYGHGTGDRVLRQVASLIKQTVRASDVIARYGGEEFVAVLPQTDAESALQAAERLRAAVEQYAFIESQSNMRFTVTVSIGIATFPLHGATREEMVYAADAAMYTAKRDGRNRVRACSAGAKNPVRETS
ncbi:MAG: sensor domain-containing diguanylate cyclase [Armatimonadetes bacterium]|nr:sensor domain-containing diguanylate cyclase [Armatimonadota bacterium]